MNKISGINPENIHTVTLQLAHFIGSSLKEEKEVKRIALCTLSLIYAGAYPKGSLFSMATKYIIGRQLNDGGWCDAEETMLSIKSLSLMNHGHDSLTEKGKTWLRSQQNPDGGWGRTNRDISRIPVTGLLLYLLPELSGTKAVSWLKDEWEQDLKSDTKLTYKGGFFLLGLSALGISANGCPLIEETYTYLFEEQNQDGGFGPWKDHPIGSDPWSTGIVLLGLVSYPDLTDRSVIERAVNWLAENQLPNGLWAYHYIEEGSAYAYWGLVEALKFLSRESS